MTGHLTWQQPADADQVEDAVHERERFARARRSKDDERAVRCVARRLHLQLVEAVPRRDAEDEAGARVSRTGESWGGGRARGSGAGGRRMVRRCRRIGGAAGLTCLSLLTCQLDAPRLGREHPSTVVVLAWRAGVSRRTRRVRECCTRCLMRRSVGVSGPRRIPAHGPRLVPSRGPLRE